MRNYQYVRGKKTLLDSKISAHAIILKETRLYSVSHVDGLIIVQTFVLQFRRGHCVSLEQLGKVCCVASYSKSPVGFLCHKSVI
jgi:hypothetical protein